MRTFFSFREERKFNHTHYYVCIDPNGGGSSKAAIMISGVAPDGRVVVRAQRNACNARFFSLFFPCQTFA